MGLFHLFDITALQGRGRSLTPHKSMRFAATAGALALAGLLAASPATAAPCRFATTRQIDKDTGVEPQLLIDGTCTDPDYNGGTFVVTNTEH
jgi:hypothetical protein